ncbi:MAG: VOC family protein [Prevotella sp.]|nr:VOC family protein [Prevotella sp.]
MTLQRIDHLVITTHDLQSCLDFYVGLLGMRHESHAGHHNLYFGDCKLSIHTVKGEFTPAATHPTYGSHDFCLIVDDIESFRQHIEQQRYPIVEGIVDRNGARGPIRSLYLYDPDGNLVELSQYAE